VGHTDVPPSNFLSSSPWETWLCRLLATLLIVGSAGLRLAYLSSPYALDLSPDEAHYWNWSRHLDWSYYSKGPLVALLIRASGELTETWSQQLTGQAMLSVRLPAIVCGGLLLCSLYVLTTQVTRREKLALGVVGLALTLPLISVGATLMTIDAPYTCCWGWALVFGYQAVFQDRNWAWIMSGIMIALGVLAKYTMVLWVPSLGLFLLFTPGLREKLLRPGFWGMLLVGALGGLPILWWNYQHDWVSLKHIQGHAGLQGAGQRIHWLGPLHYIGLQFALLLGYWFVIWFLAMVSFRPWRFQGTETAVIGSFQVGRVSRPVRVSGTDGPGDPSYEKTCWLRTSYLWWMSAPMFLFFLGFSWKNGGGEANWPVTAYLSGLVLATIWLGQQMQSPRTWYRFATQFWLVLFCGVGLGLTLLTYQSSLAYPWLVRLSGPATAQNPLPMRRFDPTCRLQGWRTLANEVDRLREELRDQGIDPVLAATSWTLPGQVSFYCQGQPVVYSLGAVQGERYSQYDFWRPNPIADYREFVGRTMLLVGEPNELIRQAFEEMDSPRLVTHEVGGQPVNRWVLTVGRGFKGFDALFQRGY
jgi:hypothetical protein